MRTLLLHNPTAGAAHPNADELMGRLYAAGFWPHYQSSKDEDYREALAEDWNLVVVAGGDGTVARVARSLRDRTTPIAILPIGTANNIARALGITGDVDAMIDHLGTAQARRLDVGLAEGPWGKRRFLEAVGFGLLLRLFLIADPSRPNPSGSTRDGRSCRNSFVRQKRNASSSAWTESSLPAISCFLRSSTSI